nr:amino acid ABC transporter substrate-binding protein [Oceanococcus sp. HetDA_MAG_MS8]
MLKTFKRQEFWLSSAWALLLLGMVLVATTWPVAAAEEDEPRPDRLQLMRETGTLRAAVYRDFPPYSYHNQKRRLVGVDVDLAKELAKRMELSLDIRPFTADENMDDDLRNQVWKGHYLGGGVADVMLHAGMDPEYVRRQDKVDLFNAYHRETLGVIYHAERYPSVPESPLTLAGSQVGVEVDSISDYYMSGAFNGRLRSSAKRMESTAAAVKAFMAGELDAVMAPRGELEGAMAMHDMAAAEFSVQEFVGMFRTAWDVGMAIKSGNPELRSALQDALSDMAADGSLDQIFAHHGLQRGSPQHALQAAK